jgi:metal-responsive CopG/Arc/MetJ family transcriptional regulator
MKRLNITLPEELRQDLETIPNKSRFIADAVKEKLEKERKRRLNELLIEGYKATKKEDKKLNEEWEETTLERWT